MFLVPIGTDAPVYHFPWGTIGLIVLTTLVQLASAVGLLPPVEELAPVYGLVHGQGPHPLQWVTSNFLHAGWLHLIGNMMFLWPFGLVVEGKIGWQRFVAIYLGIGVVECLLEQVCLRGPGVSLGASSILFGLMAIACVWAPWNDIEMAYGVWAPFFFRLDTFELPIAWLCVLLVAEEAAMAAWLRFPIGSELFHLVGAALGAGVGVSFLRGELVDCEGWDAATLLKKSREVAAVKLQKDAAVLDGRSTELAEVTPEQEQAQRTGRKMRGLKRIHQLLSAGDAGGAWAEVLRTRQVLDGFQLGQRDLGRLAQALLDAGRWTEAVAAYEEVIQRFAGDAEVSRLIVARVLVEEQRRPTAALRHLDAMDPRRLTGDAPRQYASLRRQAEELLASGVVELEGHAWESP
jgi:membrane associated rhomboid family serine protease